MKSLFSINLTNNEGFLGSENCLHNLLIQKSVFAYLCENLKFVYCDRSRDFLKYLDLTLSKL